MTDTISTTITSVDPKAAPPAAPKTRRPLAAPVTVTPAAVERVRALLDKRGCITAPAEGEFACK